jgi:hypothetical protein
MEEGIRRGFEESVEFLFRDLSTIVSSRVPKAESGGKLLSEEIDLRNVSALHGAIYYDRSHVTGTLSRDPNFFVTPEGPPSDSQIKAILDYDQKRKEMFKRGQNPLSKEHSPANPANRIAIDGKKLTLEKVQTFKADMSLVERILRGALAEAEKTHENLKSQGMKERAMAATKAALESPPMQALYHSRVYPTRTDVTNSFLDGLDYYFATQFKVDYVRKQPREMPPEISALDCFDREQSRLGQEVNRCTRCHDRKSPLYPYITDLDGWKKKLVSSDSVIKAKAKDWLERVSSRILDEPDMPPSNSREARDFSTTREGRQLIRFLKDHQNLRE